MASVTLENVRKVYPGGVEAVKGVSLAIPDGAFTVLLGPSGCGKSTLLRMIAGLETISDGTIFIGGKVVNQVEPADRDIAMVFQNYALYPHMSVYNNMAYGLRNRGTAKDEIDKRVRQAAQMLAIEDFLDRKPRALSGGQRQRVAMGRAIVREPQAFLFDEPLSNLDAKLRVQMRLEIRRLHNRLKATSIFVTHDQVEAMTLAQRIIVMNAGVMDQFGTPEEVYHRPATTFVASFIGSPPMNLLKHAPGVTEGQILGIRPEHLVLDAAGWTVQVEQVELLGAERLIYGRVGEEQLIMRLDEGKPAPAVGATVHMAASPERLHWFDAASGKRL
jgi:sn-glycerol 3-phosphate transport system ATP-binding protein